MAKKVRSSRDDRASWLISSKESRKLTSRSKKKKGKQKTKKGKSPSKGKGR